MSLEAILQRHRLPDAFRDSAERCYLPFVDWLQPRISTHDGAYVLGINGGQGTGKSTLAELIALQLGAQDCSVVVLSIDDFYLTKAERQELGLQTHPLLESRGVPGTHDIELAIDTVTALSDLPAGESLTVVRFDKSRDDRHTPSAWQQVQGPVDLIILEGWCVGSRPEADDLQAPLNALEADADPDAIWRQYVNTQLAGRYQDLFAMLDGLLFLKVPSFDAVLRWRQEQEHKLAATAPADADGIMSDAEIARFIQHYERITRHNLKTLPGIADAVIELANDHQAIALHFR